MHFNGPLFSKSYKILDEKVQRSHVSWNWRVIQSLKKTWLLIPKMTWWIWWVASLKTCTLMCSFCKKYIMLEPKKYRGDMCHCTEEWCKIWELTCALKNDMRNLTNVDPTLESLKICTLMSSFRLKYTMFEW